MRPRGPEAGGPCGGSAVPRKAALRQQCRMGAAHRAGPRAPAALKGDPARTTHTVSQETTSERES